MIDKRVTFNEAGEPVVVITLTGWDDTFRFAWALAHLQCEFADLGRRIGGSLRRRIGAKAFKERQRPYVAKGTLQWLRDDHGPETLDDLQALLPDAAIEVSGDNELTIWTSLTVDPNDPDRQRLVDWDPDGIYAKPELVAVPARAEVPDGE